MICYRHLVKLEDILRLGYFYSKDVTISISGLISSISVGHWLIGLGGCDSDYILSYGGIDCFRINFEDSEYQWLNTEPNGNKFNKSRIIQIFGCRNFTEIKEN